MGAGRARAGLDSAGAAAGAGRFAADAKQGARQRQSRCWPAGDRFIPAGFPGPAFLVNDLKTLDDTPQGAILFLRKSSPEMVTVFPRISGVVAEMGNVAGHAASLLREAKIPSIFELAGAFEHVKDGDPISLDAVQPRIYSGTLWTPRIVEPQIRERYQESGVKADPINRACSRFICWIPRLPISARAGCKSAHDVLRYCHEKAVEAMFAVNDSVLEGDLTCSKKLMTPVPVNIHVLDLGGGLALRRSVGIGGRGHRKSSPGRFRRSGAD